MAKVKPSKSAAKGKPGASTAPLVVSGRWLAGALGAVFLVALLCAYGTLALLFYQGQWQLVLHPSKTVSAFPSMKFDEVRFDTTETGVSQLYGWWIPAEAGSQWAGSTVLFLHDGSGSLSDCLSYLSELHSLGINVFAFDYRGFGRSVGPHPDEGRMRADSEAGFSYLTDTKRLNPSSVVIYGTGLGASLAAELASHHSPAGVVLDGPGETAWKIVGSDGRARILPKWLLLTERFDPAESLRTLAVPKLFLDRGVAKPRTVELYRLAASPEEYFELRGSGYSDALGRFLDGLGLH